MTAKKPYECPECGALVAAGKEDKHKLHHMEQQIARAPMHPQIIYVQPQPTYPENWWWENPRFTDLTPTVTWGNTCGNSNTISVMPVTM